MLRLDFEKPKNLDSNPVIPNVAPDHGSNGTIRYAVPVVVVLVITQLIRIITKYMIDYNSKVPSMGFDER